MSALCTKKCVPCEGGTPALKANEIEALLPQVKEWAVNEENTCITRVFNFPGFNKTLSFVNAVGWIANQQGHHPEMELSFNRCVVHFTTHAINGLSENDFICAAKVNALLEP